MASIKKRRGKYSVVYYYIDENGQKRQKWETYLTEKEAKQRKAEIEYKQGRRTFIAPNKVTVAAFLEDFVSLYGTKKWGPNTYDANLGLIQNYINPNISDILMQDVTSMVADRFITTLQKTKCATPINRYCQTEYMTPGNIERIDKLLKCACSSPNPSSNADFAALYSSALPTYSSFLSLENASILSALRCS